MPSSGRPPCSLNDANLFQRLLFGWAWPLLKLGASRPLEETDLADLHVEDSSAYNKSYIRQVWNANNGQKSSTRGGGVERRAGLGRALLKDYFRTTRFPQVLLALNSASKIGQAIALGLLMEQFTSEAKINDSTKEGYKWCSVIVGCGLITFLTKQRLYFELYRKGMQIRVGMVATLYDKSLRLFSTGNSSSFSAGKLTNLASNDVERFLSASIPSLYLILGPIEAIVILVIGLLTLGPVFAVGHALFLFLVPLQFYLGRRFVKFRRRVACITDARVTLLSQAVSGVRLMKMNAWELEFQKRIDAIREREVTTLKAASRFKALNEAIYYCSSIVVAVVIFAVNVGLGNKLTPRNVYTTLTLLNILHLSLTKQIPNAVMQLSECHVSCQRIQEFLELPEASKMTIDVNKDSSEPQPFISFTNVSCVWDEAQIDDARNSNMEMEPSNVALSDISLSFDGGRLYGIIGKVGSGKSALIQAIAGELNNIGGNVVRSYRSLSHGHEAQHYIGFAAQSPWIMNGSIRDNIVMGLPFREDWYGRVIDAVGLRMDFSIFVQGDATLVGDRGVQCSGGQKARIGLARAYYRDPQVLLLDDPLSAVDSTVARSICQKAIRELGVQRGKCIILATHQHQFLGHGDHCIILEKGKVVSSALVESSTADFATKAAGSEEKEYEPKVKEKRGRCADVDSGQEEVRNTGIIAVSTWSAYGASAGNSGVCAVFFVFFAITQSALLVLIVEVGKWAEAPINSQQSPYWFGIILGLAAFLLILSIVRAQMSYQILIGASKKLHNRMLDSVLRSKVVFFDTNPLGRILNRFSADVGICDETLPLTIYDFLVGAFIVCGGVITASVVLPFVLVALPPLIWCFITLRRIFVKTTRELKRLEGVSRSPIFAMMSESLHGVSTLRANDCVNYFKTKFELVHDTHTRAYFAFVASSRWFATRMDILSFTLMAVASFFAVLFNDQNWFKVDPSVLGLTLTLLIQIAGTNFPWIVRQSAEVVNQMTSVERILEFGALESEASLKLDSDKHITSWPNNGSIEVQDLSIRYRPDLPLALEGATFCIPAGTRIGVVGRTGSGKSTLVQAFFRLLEAEHGSILIDGIDISNVGLHILRGNISVIPQTPTLFSGCTLRENLDLFGLHSDEDIQRTLEDVHLHKTIMELPLGVNTIISDEGTNFSVGERQLLCLARANLKKCKILVLDEATASVDKDTDHLLHASLDAAYENATIIKIAHRLDSVIGDDYILVLGSGKVVEFGTPAELLQAKAAFYRMVTDTNMSSELTARANAKYKKKVN